MQASAIGGGRSSNANCGLNQHLSVTPIEESAHSEAIGEGALENREPDAKRRDVAALRSSLGVDATQSVLGETTHNARWPGIPCRGTLTL